ncbi:hypothetical protein vBVhaSVHB1_47 [Vibrio phage vB_VhaS-VHB1]|nr:hypothetical protein vBVhaSVHB1_47 [Vibrio phage vB_VhaS-VHB1]
MAIYRMEFTGGGFKPMAGSFSEVKDVFDELLYAIAGTVEAPKLVKYFEDGSRAYYCYEIGRARGVILQGYKSNPVKGFLEGL